MKKILTILLILFSTTLFAQFRVKGTDGLTYTTLTQVQINDAITKALIPLQTINKAQSDSITLLNKKLATFRDVYFSTGFNVIKGTSVDTIIVIKDTDVVKTKVSLDSLIQADNIANKGFEGLIRILQGNTKLDREDIDAIKLWMEKVKKITFN